MRSRPAARNRTPRPAAAAQGAAADAVRSPRRCPPAHILCRFRRPAAPMARSAVAAGSAGLDGRAAPQGKPRTKETPLTTLEMKETPLAAPHHSRWRHPSRLGPVYRDRMCCQVIVRLLCLRIYDGRSAPWLRLRRGARACRDLRPGNGKLECINCALVVSSESSSATIFDPSYWQKKSRALGTRVIFFS